MIMRPLLSILTPAIPERLAQLTILSAKISAQCLGREQNVEWLCLIDPRGHRTIGEKRDELVQLSRGRFVAFLDDDDDISDDYVFHLLSAIESADDRVSVITFMQNAKWNNISSRVIFRLWQENGAFVKDGITKRNAWHVCAWDSSIAKRHHFPKTNYGEDWAWASHLCAEATGEIHIPRIIHTYIHDEKHTAAPPPRAAA